MIKTILKEGIILILLVVCILLVFGIAFYDYIPVTKVIPSKVSYEVPESVKEDLSLDVESEQIKNTVITYSIDGEDLKKYQSAGSLTEGKPNPFSSYINTVNSTVADNGSGVYAGNVNSR